MTKKRWPKNHKARRTRAFLFGRQDELVQKPMMINDKPEFNYYSNLPEILSSIGKARKISPTHRQV